MSPVDGSCATSWRGTGKIHEITISFLTVSPRPDRKVLACRTVSGTLSHCLRDLAEGVIFTTSRSRKRSIFKYMGCSGAASDAQIGYRNDGFLTLYRAPLYRLGRVLYEMRAFRSVVARGYKSAAHKEIVHESFR